ncbi:hypothetical protein ACN47E_007391 [Coniothyrium glycines]
MAARLLQPIQLLWQLLSSLPTSIIILLAVFSVPISYGFYNAYVHPLRHYPGPLLWRSFRFPYVIAIQRGILHNKLKSFHTTYGPIVRIAPNELSYADSRAWRDIYSNRPGHLPFERNPTWFAKMTPDEPDSIMGPDEHGHARYRRAFANSFSERQLKEQAPVLEHYVDLFIAKLSAPVVAGHAWTHKHIDLKEWFHHLIFDISGDMSYGSSFGSLQTGTAHWWVQVAEDFGKGLALIASVNHYRPLNRYLRHIIPARILQRSRDHRVLSSHKAQQRVAMDVDRPDWVTPAKQFDDRKAGGALGGPLTAPEWGINLLIIAFAASETTASSLTGIVRELVQHRGVLGRLTREIREAFGNEGDMTVASTKKLVYLEAVIHEGLRLDPTVVIGIPRVVPKGGDTVCERYVPEGTYVTFNQFPANRQAYNWHNPNSFIPERFLDPDPNDDHACLQPFQVGRHTCIGKQVAYSEMRLTLCRLLWRFDLALADENDRFDWGDQKSYIIWDKRPLKVVLRHAAR